MQPGYTEPKHKSNKKSEKPPSRAAFGLGHHSGYRGRMSLVSNSVKGKSTDASRHEMRRPYADDCFGNATSRGNHDLHGPADWPGHRSGANRAVKSNDDPFCPKGIIIEKLNCLCFTTTSRPKALQSTEQRRHSYPQDSSHHNVIRVHSRFLGS
jgi:hypothetical protein